MSESPAREFRLVRQPARARAPTWLGGTRSWRDSNTRAVGTSCIPPKFHAEPSAAPDCLQRCIFTRRWESIPVSGYLGVIDRYSVGPPRPERSVGRHVYSFESPNSCPEPYKPVSGKAGPVRSEDVCPTVLCWNRCCQSPTGYGPAPPGCTVGRGQR